MRATRMLVAVTAVSFSLGSHAYWAAHHKDINRQTFEQGRPWGEDGFKRGGRTVTTALKYLANQFYIARPRVAEFEGVPFDGRDENAYGLDKPGDAPRTPLSLPSWLIQGGLWEDGFADMGEAQKWGGRRAVNHFHDPLAAGAGGYTGITPLNAASMVPYWCLLRRGSSVTQWVMNGASGGQYGENHWGYPTIVDSAAKAFAQPLQKDRDAAMAAQFRAMGQVMHLVEDNTVPDHARDLPHPGDGWEEYMGNVHPDAFGATPRPWNLFPLSIVERQGLRALWDRDVYVGAGAARMDASDPPGLDEYVNSNFFAWNRMTKVAGIPLPGALDFTTIPTSDGSAWVGGNTRYPWPKTSSPSVLGPIYHDTAPGSVPFTPAALEDFTYDALHEPTHPTRKLNDLVWGQYTSRLMGAAHGYAQTVLSLVLQPARAEIATSVDDSGLLNIRVRLWNLWAAGSPNAVTWHVDRLKVLGIRSDAADVRLGPVHEEIVLAQTMDVAPGQVQESPSVALTWKQRRMLSVSSHTVVLVTAHLGSGNTQTALAFAVPIPNAHALVEQTGGRDDTVPFHNQVGNCVSSGNACEYQGEDAYYRNPLEQTVTGTIKLLPGQLDIRGQAADAAVRNAQKEDARITEVILFAWSKVADQQDYVPIISPTTSFTVTGGDLTAAGPARWVRPKDAPDNAPTTLSFTATFHNVAAYASPGGTDLEAAARASGSIFVGVFTNSGAFYVQRLMLWPLHSLNNASNAVTAPCNVLQAPRPNLLPESRYVCHVDHPNGACQYEVLRTQIAVGDWGIGSTQAAPSNPTGFPGLPVPDVQGDSVRATRFMGHDVDLIEEAKVPHNCEAGFLIETYPRGSGQHWCDVMGPSGLAYTASDYTPWTPTMAASCPTGVGLNAPLSITYKHFFLAPYKSDAQALLGITVFPPESTFQLTAAH